MAHQSAIQSAQRTLLTEGTGLKLLHDAMGEELGQAFAQAVETILAAPGRVIISGMGKSGHVGRKIAATMASTGTPAHFVHPGEASHGDLGMIQPDDVILAMSGRDFQGLHGALLKRLEVRFPANGQPGS